MLTNGYYGTIPVYCPVNGWDCPYATKDCLCRLERPFDECDDFAAFWKNWKEWEKD